MNNISINVERIRENIARICSRIGIDDSSITIVAASKTVPLESVHEAIKAGITDIGENRIQEAEQKFHELPETVTRHMIGHLQKNKVRKALQLVDIIQSLDSLELAQKINNVALEFEKIMPVFIEINIAGESTKYGFHPEHVTAAVKEILHLSNLRIKGLMTLGTFTENPENSRMLFRKMRNIKDTIEQSFPDIHLKHLSMGMSHDYEIAIEEGATMVRLGTAIFGQRAY